VSDLAASSAPPRHERLVLTICLIIVTALAWAYLVRLERQMSAGMESDAAMAAMGMDMRAPWGTSDIALTYVMWVVMMIGMMVPSAGPVLLLFSGTAAARQERGLPVSVLMFGSGYLSVWALFGAAAPLAQLWVAILGGVVLLEKISPVGINVARAAGALILLAGIALLVAAP